MYVLPGKQEDLRSQHRPMGASVAAAFRYDGDDDDDSEDEEFRSFESKDDAMMMCE